MIAQVSKFVDPPARKLTGREFEDIIKPRLETMRLLKQASIGRYGVQATVTQGGEVTHVMRSLPDYEGVFGRAATQVIFDAKVCSQSSFDLSQYRIESNKPKARQLKHMYERDSFHAMCFFLIHWNERSLKTRTEDAETFAFPVSRQHPFWSDFESGSEKSINRRHCIEYGVSVGWTIAGQERTARPDLWTLLQELQSPKLNIGLVPRIIS
jgi:penicillin-binding protein-related factor A (putative recombinase)